MSDKTYVFEQSGATADSGIWQAVATMANQKGLDTSAIMALRNQGGLFGNNGDLLDRKSVV